MASNERTGDKGRPTSARSGRWSSDDRPSWMSKKVAKYLIAEINYEKARELWPNIEDLEAFRISLLAFASQNKGGAWSQDAVEILFGGVVPDVYEPVNISEKDIAEALEALFENDIEDSTAYQQGYENAKIGNRARFNPLDAMFENEDEYSAEYRQGYQLGREDSKTAARESESLHSKSADENDKILEELIAAEIGGVSQYVDDLNQKVEENILRLKGKEART